MDVKIILKAHPKVSEPIASGFSMHTILSFKSIENQHDVYRGKYCMKRKLWILKRTWYESN